MPRRLLTIAAATIVAMATFVPPASAALTTLKVFVTDTNGSLGVITPGGGTALLDDHLNGIPVDLTANPNGNVLYYVDTVGDGIGAVDTHTYADLGYVRVCDRPQSAALDAARSRLYVSCNGSNGGVDSSVVVVDVSDPTRPTVAAKIPFASWPTRMAVDPALGLLLVDVGNAVDEVSTATNTIVGAVAVAPGSLSVSTGSPVFYDAVGNEVYATDLTDGEVFQAVYVPQGATSSALCANNDTMWVSGGGGTSQVNLDTGAITRTYPTSGGDLALSADCATLYEVSGRSVVSIATATGATTSIPAPTNGITAMAVAAVPYVLRPFPPLSVR